MLLKRTKKYYFTHLGWSCDDVVVVVLEIRELEYGDWWFFLWWSRKSGFEYVFLVLLVAVPVAVVLLLKKWDWSSTCFLERGRLLWECRSQYFWSGITFLEHLHFFPSVLLHLHGSWSGIMNSMIRAEKACASMSKNFITETLREYVWTVWFLSRFQESTRKC